MVETAIVFPIILILILCIFQFTILITCQVALNFAAFQSARAVLLSSNQSKNFGYGNAHSIVQDARHTARSTLSIFYPLTGLGWMYPPSVKLYRHDGQAKNGISKNRLTLKSMPQPPNQSIWIILKAKAIIVIPFMKRIFGFLGFTTIKATCLVDTPSIP